MTIANTMAFILTHAGYDAVPFTSPFEALRYAREVNLGLLIAEMRMTEMSGIRLARDVRALRPIVRILFVSAMPSDSETIEQDEALGASCTFLCKPIRPQDLIHTVELLLEGHS